MPCRRAFTLLTHSLGGLRAGRDQEGRAAALPFRSQQRFRYHVWATDDYSGACRHYRDCSDCECSRPLPDEFHGVLRLEHLPIPPAESAEFASRLFFLEPIPLLTKPVYFGVHSGEEEFGRGRGDSARWSWRISFRSRSSASWICKDTSTTMKLAVAWRLSRKSKRERRVAI
jgi:hypothetical protein